MTGVRERLLRVLRPVLGGVQLNHLVRLLPVADLVRDAAPRTVLDVGSGSRGVARWLPHGLTVVALDHSFDDYGAASRPAGDALAVLGDVARLPFVDDAFDVVIAVDLLEHLPSGLRATAVHHLVRVARHRVVIAGPAGQAAYDADTRLAGVLHGRPGGVPPWLQEHVDNGFPEIDELRELLAPHGDVSVHGNLNVGAHERLVLTELAPTAFLPTRLRAAALGALYRRSPAGRSRVRAQLAALGAGDREPTYRAVLVLDLEPRASTRRATAQ